MKHQGIQILISFVLALLVFLGIFHFINHNVGISRWSLEADARKSSTIEDDWLVSADISDDMAAMLFYAPDQSDFSVQIYVTHPGFSLGYFFRYGGNDYAAHDGIGCFTLDGNPYKAYLSTNVDHICRVEIDNGNRIEIRHLDPDTPFAVILPVNCGSVTFYDSDGNSVNITNRTM